MYRVTKHHTAGLLAGITTEEITSVRFEVGDEITRAIGGGAYTVTAVTTTDEEN